MKTTTFCCSICPRTYQFKSSLDRHLKSHDREKYPFHCRQCSQYFSTTDQFDIHNREFHSALPQQCDICAKFFTTLGGLKQHRLIHKEINDDENYLKCPFKGCDKRFSNKLLYEDHIHYHTGEKPHACTVCGRKFSNRYKKTSHEKLCRGEVTYFCSSCASMFTDRGSLRKHEKAQHEKIMHTCTECGKSFAYQCSLYRHKQTKGH